MFSRIAQLKDALHFAAKKMLTVGQTNACRSTSYTFYAREERRSKSQYPYLCLRLM
jgi:hypothetical protein